MITVKIKPGEEEALRFRLGSVVAKVNDRIGQAVTREAINLVGYIVQNKLSKGGKDKGGNVRDGALHVQTGRLRRSITYKTEQVGDTFRAMVGTNVKYARVHELGFQGEVNVPEHGVKEFQRMQSMAFGKMMKQPRMVTVKAHVVKAHSMKMNIQPRPFLRPSLDENRGRIQTNIKAAIVEALRA